MNGPAPASPPLGAQPPVWDRLVAAAVLGTERRPFTGVTLGGPLGSTAAAAAASAGFAGAVATIWAYLHAGRSARPPRPSVPAPAGVGPAGVGPAGVGPAGVGPALAPADPRPLLPAGPVGTLAAILEDPRFRPVLPEWLHLAASDGRRLPPEWLPDLLDAPLAGGPARLALEAAAGPRLSWLVERNPAWSAPGSAAGDGARLAHRFLSNPGDQDVKRDWSAAGDEVRIMGFATVRRSDPLTALRLAEQVWPDEPGATRAALVACLGDGLSLEDEAFLEGRLDDRRGDVRREAARLLGRLPGSGLGERMKARSLPLVRIRETPFRSLQISLPSDVDASARRDGVAPPASGHLTGEIPGAGTPESEGSRLFVELVAATPLPSWESYLGTAAEVLVGLAASPADGSPASSLLLEGWSRAAVNQGDTRWATALLGGGARPDGGLTALVPPAEADRAVVAWLKREPLSRSLVTLAGLPTPWSHAVSGAVLERVADAVSAGDSPGAGPVRDALGSFGLALHPGRAPAAAALAVAVGQLPDGQRGAPRLFWARTLTQMVTVVHFRHAMYREFR